MLRTPKFWPREFHGLYSHKESDTTERLSLCSFPGGSVGKAATCNAGDLGSIPGLGRSPGEGKVYPLQYSCLENFPWAEEPGRLQTMGSEESDTIEQLTHRRVKYLNQGLTAGMWRSCI